MAEFHLYSAKGPEEMGGLECIVRVTLWDSVGRSRDPVNGHILTVRLSSGSGYDLVGTFDQRKQATVAREPFKLSGESTLNFPMAEGDVLYVNASDYGTPANDLAGFTVEADFVLAARVEQETEARDAGELPRHEIVESLIQMRHTIQDPEVREAIEDVVGQANRILTPRWSQSVVLSGDA